MSALARIALVFGLLAVVLLVLKRSGGVGSKRAGAMQVVASARLGKGAALTVVRLEGREIVLGVTEHAVTLLQPGTPEAVTALPEPGPAVPDAVPGGALGAALRDRLRRPAGRDAQPPSTGEFLTQLWAALRKQPLAESDVSTSAVAAALAHATGTDLPLVPGPRGPHVADGTATPDSPRTRSACTDALLDEEHPWSRACAPAFRAAERPPALR